MRAGREGRGRGRGGASALPAWSGRLGPALARSACPPQGFGAEGAGANVGPVWLSLPRMIGRKVALGPSPASCFLPPALLVSWSRAGGEEPGRDLRSLGSGAGFPSPWDPAPGEAPGPGPQGREQTFWIVPGHLSGKSSTARGGGARPGGTGTCTWHAAE